MGIGNSLSDILELAKQDRKAALELADSLIVPLDPKKFPLDAIRTTYGDGSPLHETYEPMRQLPKGREFIFDAWGHFFLHHSRTHFLQIKNTVLHNQPNEGLMSIVMGRMPARGIEAHNHHDGACGYYVWVPSMTILNPFYIYMESGVNRQPELFTLIDGNLPLSPNRPILYASKPCEEEPVWLTRGFRERIKVFVPHTHECIYAVSLMPSSEGSPQTTHSEHLLRVAGLEALADRHS